MARGRGAAAHYLQQLVVMVIHGGGTTVGSRPSPAPAAPLASSLLVFLITRLLLSTSSSTGRRRRHGNSKKKKLPPSPPGRLPVIGHLHLVIGSGLPPVSLRDLAARHGRDGLLLLQLGSAPTLVVSSASAAEAVLRTHDHVLASRTWSPARRRHPFPRPDGCCLRALRRAVAAGQEAPHHAHAQLQQGALLPPWTPPGGYTNDIVCRAVLGESHREGGRNRIFRELSETNVSLLGGFNLEDYVPRLAKLELLRKVVCAKATRVHRRWDQLFDKLIDEHQHQRQGRQQEQQDFIHVLLSVQEEYGLTRDAVKAILVDMFEAVIETAHLLLDYAMAELMINKHVRTKLQEEVRRCKPAARESSDDMVMEEDLNNMAYLKAVVKETLRLHPPVPLLLPHLSITDCDINGYSIPSETRVFINVWSLGRDPVYWERPEEFMPERFLEGGCAVDVDMKGKDFQFLPFGSGRRICPGINFGIATVELMLANLMYHFDWELRNTIEGVCKGVDMTELFGLTLRRKEKLILVPKIPA